MRHNKALLSIASIAASLLLISASATLSVETVIDWLPKGDGYEPFTVEERLAVQLARSGADTLNEPPFQGEVEDIQDNAATIRITKTVQDNGTFEYVYRYRIQDARIIAAATPTYHQTQDNRRQQSAKDVAERFFHGEAVARPLIYDGFLYKPKSEGKCLIEVDEFNTEREFQQTFEFNFCE